MRRHLHLIGVNKTVRIRNGKNRLTASDDVACVGQPETDVDDSRALSFDLVGDIDERQPWPCGVAVAAIAIHRSGAPAKR